eukprot:scaffold31880_cov157-Isochrysis_galbana.AAC.1
MCASLSRRACSACRTPKAARCSSPRTRLTSGKWPGAPVRALPRQNASQAAESAEAGSAVPLECRSVSTRLPAVARRNLPAKWSNSEMTSSSQLTSGIHFFWARARGRSSVEEGLLSTSAQRGAGLRMTAGRFRASRLTRRRYSRPSAGGAELFVSRTSQSPMGSAGR